MSEAGANRARVQTVSVCALVRFLDRAILSLAGCSGRERQKHHHTTGKPVSPQPSTDCEAAGSPAAGSTSDT